MGESEWNCFERDSRISLPGAELGYPFEAHIWQLPQEQQIAYLKSIAVAGCNLGQARPERFTDWITWKLGEEIARTYMLPYNRKMFGEDLDRLGDRLVSGSAVTRWVTTIIASRASDSR
mgnify:CR=1 FL=1